jgi:acyl-CoA reductase-like NAD-dependent aldehyde dehydrogenase
VGNCVVCKPSEFASATAWMLCSAMNEAGVPPGVVNMVFGLGSVVGKSLTVHPDIPAISFTGGTVTAQHIIRDSAPFSKKLYLELGGKKFQNSS